MSNKQNLTVQLDRDTIRRAKVLAAKRGTSVSAFIASQIREAVESDAAYEAAQRSALEWLEEGFRMGGRRLDREALHER